MIKISNEIQTYINECIDDKIYSEKYIYKFNPKVSIIVPIYNGVSFIPRALKSIQKQSLKKIEIIFIDDNSKDESITLLKKYQIYDKRIIIYHNKINKGILYTKSYGVSKAHGKFIMELDQDDMFCDTNLFQSLYNLSEKQKFDVIKFKHLDLINLTEVKGVNFNFSLKIIDPLKSHGYFITDGLIWNKFIKRELYLKALNCIGKKRLQKKVINTEDFTPMFHIFLFSQKMVVYDTCGVIHHIRNNSAGKSRKGIDKINILYNDYSFFFKYVCEITKNNFFSKYEIYQNFLYLNPKLKNIINAIPKENICYVHKSYGYVFLTRFISSTKKKIMRKKVNNYFNLIYKGIKMSKYKGFNYWIYTIKKNMFYN